jgi:hypothetical protein
LHSGVSLRQRQADVEILQRGPDRGPLFMLSSHTRGGASWDLYSKHYGAYRDPAILSLGPVVSSLSEGENRQSVRVRRRPSARPSLHQRRRHRRSGHRCRPRRRSSPCSCRRFRLNALQATATSKRRFAGRRCSGTAARNGSLATSPISLWISSGSGVLAIPIRRRRWFGGVGDGIERAARQHREVRGRIDEGARRRVHPNAEHTLFAPGAQRFPRSGNRGERATSSMMSRSSWLAVMSRKVSSSAPASS